MDSLIVYHSYSGNTEEVAEILGRELESEGVRVDMHDIGNPNQLIPNMDDYDLILFGTFTWDYGDTPEEVKDFILDVGYKPKNVEVFGTGDTQFGGDLFFCRAVDKLATFFNSEWEGLKIEQSPRGQQEVKVENWVGKILESKRERTTLGRTGTEN